MAHLLMIFLSSLLFLNLFQGFQAVEYNVVNNDLNSPGGIIFNNTIGVDYFRQQLEAASELIWRTFRQTTAADRKNITHVNVFIENTLARRNTDVPFYTSGGDIHFNTRYIAQYSGDVRSEFTGVLYHQTTHIWQWRNESSPGGLVLVDGIADYLRLKANFAAFDWVGPGEGSPWNSGYGFTARFYEYCVILKEEFVAELNGKMRNGYSENYFVEILGKPADQLFREYKARYNGGPIPADSPSNQTTFKPNHRERGRSVGVSPGASPSTQPTFETNHHERGLSTEVKVLIGVFTGIGVLLIVLFLTYRRICFSYCLFNFHWRNNIKSSTKVETFLESCGNLALQRYKYSEIKEMTNSFKETLGQGGYGSVYKGKLKRDGRLVAVKMLNESKGNGEEFINEVATIGRTNHVNVVSLLGYCTEGTKRALVYEFMVNGSLEKFIYNEKTSSTPLGWEKLYQIALGIARGLEYLHRGCNMRILHFDIKPHNILLDQEFCPKISDFGLAKLCPTKESVVSMLVPRGTIGYIAPEVYCRNFGGVSHKSDVYSYGMMVLEIIGRRKNIDPTVQNISEIYFPQWIYNHLKDINVEGLGEIFEDETTKKMIIVALWCIQTQPADRPSISKVVEMLEGSTEELQIPPNPFQDLPSRSSP